jgi:hypothetical protein
MEFSEERCLQLSSCVIAGPVALEYLIETLKKEGPEFMEGRRVWSQRCGRRSGGSDESQTAHKAEYNSIEKLRRKYQQRTVTNSVQYSRRSRSAS